MNKVGVFRWVSLGIFLLVLVYCSAPKKPQITSTVNQAGGVQNAPRTAPNLTFYWIDVEGGAATLIVTPAGESILIDTGNPGNRDADRIFHVAKNVVGLTQIDHLITTHWHIDHYGGASELAKKIPIIEVHDKGIPEMLPEDKEFASRIQPYRDMTVKKRTRLQLNQLVSLKKIPGKLPPLSLRFIGFDRKFTPVAATKTRASLNCDVADKTLDTTDNGNSTVLVLDYGPFRFFNGGDLTWNVEKTLVCPQNIIGTVDVYQVNHHGLDQSNHPALIKNLAPTVAIMNNGSRKGCGPETVTTLRNIPSLQGNYQVHKNVRPDSLYNTANEFIANLKENCKADYIQMTVAPDGKNYTVSIPARNHTKTFVTKTNH